MRGQRYHNKATQQPRVAIDDNVMFVYSNVIYYVQRKLKIFLIFRKILGGDIPL